MTVYVDNQHKCHAYPAEGRTPYDIQFFNGKAPGVIECYEYYPAEADRAEQIRAVKPTDAIDAYQKQYEIDEAQRWDSLGIPQEQDFMATRNYPAESFLVVQGQLYRVLHGIRNGGRIITGQNVVPITTEEYINIITEG